MIKNNIIDVSIEPLQMNFKPNKTLTTSVSDGITINCYENCSFDRYNISSLLREKKVSSNTGIEIR